MDRLVLHENKSHEHKTNIKWELDNKRWSINCNLGQLLNQEKKITNDTSSPTPTLFMVRSQMKTVKKNNEINDKDTN